MAEAETAFREALEVNRRLYGGDNRYSVMTISDLAEVLSAQGKHAEATVLCRQEVATVKKLYGDATRSFQKALVRLGRSLELEGKLAEAEAVWRENVAAERKLVGAGHPFLANSLVNLAHILTRRSRRADAEPVLREALAIRRRTLGNENLETIKTAVSLGSALHLQGKHVEAEQVFREALALWKDGRWPEQPAIGDALAGLGKSLEAQEKHVEAEAHLRDALPLYRKTGRGAQMMSAFDPLARVLMAQNKPDDLQRLVQEEVRGAREVEASGAARANPKLGVILHHAALALHGAQDLKEACALAEEAWDLYERHPDWPHGERSHAAEVLEAILTELGEHKALTSLRRRVADLLRSRQPPDDPALAGTLAKLAMDLLAEEQFADAEAPAREALAIREKAAPDEWTTFNSRSQLGGSLLGQTKLAEAEPLLLSGYEGMKEREASIPPMGKVRIKEALQRLAQLYEAKGDRDKAADWMKKLAEMKAVEAGPVAPRGEEIAATDTRAREPLRGAARWDRRCP